MAPGRPVDPRRRPVVDRSSTGIVRLLPTRDRWQDPPVPSVGFIGLGSQGAGMAQRMIDEGLPTTLWARRAATLGPFAGRATVADDPEALGRASEVVGICVTDGAAVREVTLGPHGVLAGMAA